MARFQVTAAAVNRLRELRNDYPAEPTVVVLYWTGPQADNRRRPDGSTEWVHVSEGEWHVTLDPRARYDGTPLPLEVIDDLEFIVKEFPQQNPRSIAGRTLDYVNGDFHVS